MNSLSSGITFIVRVKNEESTLSQCLNSLKGLSIPHEILVILNLCEDNSEIIAKEAAALNPNITLHYYDFEISRPGYENLCTDPISSHSLINYSNFGFTLSQYYWRFYWDADFIMTSAVKNYLESKSWCKVNSPQAVRFYAVDNNGIMHGQDYLSSHHFYFDKYWFWELKNSLSLYHVDDPQYAIYHSSSLNSIKDYWKKLPWFETEDSEESIMVRDRLKKVTDLLGDETIGQARASNVQSIPILTKAIGLEDNIKALGIEPVGGWLK